jgi:hypothetical protein
MDAPFPISCVSAATEIRTLLASFPEEEKTLLSGEYLSKDEEEKWSCFTAPHLAGLGHR